MIKMKVRRRAFILGSVENAIFRKYSISNIITNITNTL